MIALKPSISNSKEALFALDPIVPSGTVAIESDTGKKKLGDGVVPYSRLPYVDDNASDVQSIVYSANENPFPTIKIPLGVNDIVTAYVSITNKNNGPAINLPMTGLGGTSVSMGVQIGDALSIPNSWQRFMHRVISNSTHDEEHGIMEPFFSALPTVSNCFSRVIIKRRTAAILGETMSVDVYSENNSIGASSIAAMQTKTGRAIYQSAMPQDFRTSNPIDIALFFHPDVRGIVKILYI